MNKKDKGLWIIGFDDWEYSTTGGEKIPTYKYCWLYLTKNPYQSSLMYRLGELFRRLITNSLKPRQIFPSSGKL